MPSVRLSIPQAIRFARVSALTTKYGEHHIVLAQCVRRVMRSGDDERLGKVIAQPVCSKLADPYLERDATVIFIDLLLLKIGVYRHFLWNRRSAMHGRHVARFAFLVLVLETCTFALLNRQETC